MKSKILHGFLLLLIATLLLSCKPRELPKEKEFVTIAKTITEVKRDTIVKVQSDSSFYEAMIECQNGIPILLQPTLGERYQITSGKNLQPPKVILSDAGKLKISCKYLTNQLKITLKEKQILESKLSEKIITPPPEYIENQLSWWQKLWINLGKILSAAVLIFFLTKIPWKAFLKP
jgi:hypothetical protein